LDKDSLRLKTSNADLNEKNYLDQSFNVLQESKNKLQKIVNEKYDHALNTNDVPQLERFFKIFPLIGQSEDGLEKFSSYLCRQINQAADQNFLLILNTDKTEKRWNIMFADALILLFEKVARVIEAYQPVIETYYGNGNMFLFIKNIQKECDIQAIKILDKFKEIRNLTRIFKTVQQSNLNNFSRNTSLINNMSVGNNLSKVNNITLIINKFSNFE
jgi:conserved oligomeric Golgi complex subunit 4